MSNAMRFTLPRVVWGVALAVAAWGVPSAQSFAADELPPPRLQMVNGDYYSGHLRGSDEAGVVAWQSDDVVEPLRFALSSIAAAHFQRAGEPLRPQGEFCVELAGGDALFGTLLSLTAEHLELETKNFGRVRIARNQVVRLEPWGDTSGIEYMGPEGLVGWTVTGGAEGGDQNGWREDAGHPLTLQPGTLAMPGVAIPAQASIELELSWRNKADFSLQLGTERDPAKLAAQVAQFQGNRQQAPGVAPQPVREEPPTAFEVAIWGDSAVLVREQEQQADLARLERLASGAGRLALRLYLDQDAGVVSAYTVEGKFLASVKADGNGGQAARGIRIINKRGDLRLERLVIRRWGGAAPQELAAGKSHLQLRDGTALDGASAEFDGEKREFVVTADGEERRVPVADFAGLTMGGAEKMPDCTLRLSLHDGIRLNGTLQRVTDDEVIMARPGVEPALEVPIELVRSLIGLKPRAPENQPGGPRLGRLETASTVSHGLLVPAESDGEGGDGLAWRPFGSVGACALREGLSGRIVYRTPPPAIAAQSPQQRPAPAQNRGVWGALVGSFQTPAAGNGAAANDDTASYNQLLWLRAGDRIPCIVKSIDERGVTFATPVLEATFLPHESIKAWDCVAGSTPRALEPAKMTRLLTLPRMQRENPPTHLIESVGGDFLRGRVESLDDKLLRIEVRLETKEIPRSQIARIIWFEKPPKPEAPAADAPAGAADAGATAANAGSDEAPVNPADGVPTIDAAAGLNVAEDTEPQHANDGVSAAIAASKTVVQAICRDGVRLTFLPERLAEEALVGASELLGPCSVPLAEVDQLYFGAAILSAAEELTYSVWRLYPAPDPKFVTEDGAPVDNISGRESSLVGQPAPDFKLEFADQGQFQLSEQRGHVVVLDFWASWCGPCMQAMPEVDALAREYGERISLVAVNLQEDRATISAALERLGIQPRVVLDIDGAAAEKFGVTAIPQTVVIDAEGKVVRVFIGGGPNLVTDLRAAIDESLGEPTSP
jgi:thiol-disulfide isomerase/thioredoxin